MKTMQSLSISSSMTTREKDTAIGVGVGAVAGSVLTGGAAGGSVIGNEAGKDKT